jgi:hypothetical protein
VSSQSLLSTLLSMGISGLQKHQRDCDGQYPGLTPDERSPLLRNGRTSSKDNSSSDPEFGTCQTQDEEDSPPHNTPKNITGVISILLLGKRLTRFSIPTQAPRIAYSQWTTGVFIANADVSLVLATSGTISSEFNQLGNAGWLITSYTLAMCAAQSLVASLSTCSIKSVYEPTLC